MATKIKVQSLNPICEQFNIRQSKALAGVFILLLFIFISLKIQAQETRVWSLEDCINYALEHNIDIKKQSLNIDYQGELLLQSKLGMLPNLNGYVSHGYNWGQAIDPFTNQFATDRVRSNNLNLSANVDLFNGLQKLNTIKRNMLNLEAAQYDVNSYKDEIAISVATAYLQTLFYIEYIEIGKNQLQITDQQVERTGKLVEAGTLARGDLLTIEAQQASEELSLVEAENNLTLSYLTLSQLLELSTPKGFVIEKPELGLFDDQEKLLDPEQIFAFAVEIRPEIKSAQIKVESSEKYLSIARGSLYPRLSLNGSWGSGYSGANQIGSDKYEELIKIGETQDNDPYLNGIPVMSTYSVYESYDVKSFGDQLSDNNNRTVGLNLSIPIFNGWGSRSSVAQAKIGIADANLDLQLQKNTLYKVIQQAYNDAEAALNKHKAALKKVNATQEAFKYAEQKFNVGLINSVEYNDAKKEHNNALSELIQAKYDYVFRITVIDFYLGKPLTLKR
ncbi:MAG: TolC family protein [Bacteroidetes bacterium]|nr:TolC family protein [Bacteroidota bacterium]MBL7103889.1 TolC family protein [Bacteroidales bacterium]